MHNGTTFDELLHVLGMDPCCYTTVEFRGDTQQGKLIHCTNPPSWMDARGNLFCDVHPTPWDAEQAKVLIKAIECDRRELEVLRSGEHYTE